MPKEASKTKDIWNSKRIPDYFKILKKSGRYKIWCKRCKRLFISRYHLLNHKQKICQLVRATPHFSLQHANDEDLIKIAGYLDLQNLVNMIIALPRLLISHGIRVLWKNTFERCYFTPWKWICKNVEHIRDIDFFLIALRQGRNDHQENINQYFSTYINGEKNCKSRRACIWWINTSTSWTPRNNVKDSTIFGTMYW